MSFDKGFWDSLDETVSTNEGYIEAFDSTDHGDTYLLPSWSPTGFEYRQIEVVWEWLTADQSRAIVRQGPMEEAEIEVQVPQVWRTYRGRKNMAPVWRIRNSTQDWRHQSHQMGIRVKSAS